MPITANKGEWSEAYVLLRLLSQGKLYAANEHLERIEDIYFPILKVIRNESTTEKREYRINDISRKVEIYRNNELLMELDCNRFGVEAYYLYTKIVEGGDRAFAITRSEEFIHSIGCTRLAAPSTEKADITLQMHDIYTGYEPICGFSIKSEIGAAPTLINASGATNFIYEVTGLTDNQISEINAIETGKKIKERMSRIFSEAESVRFIRVNNDVFNENLTLIDSMMDEILAYALIYHFRDELVPCNEVVERLEAEDPLGYGRTGIYKHKFKEFLCCAALGMKPAQAWDGRDEANGGYIVVTQEGDVLAYHIYNRDSFKEYLMNNTRFEKASTKKHGYASLYKENGHTYLKLNMQIRFI